MPAGPFSDGGPGTESSPVSPGLERPLLLQVVPPGSGGVRDFAEQLAKSWCSAGWAPQLLPLSRESAQQQSLKARVQALCHAQQDVSVVLHFSGYGYDSRGVCPWLRDQLAGLRTLPARVWVVTVFHELCASGPPWGSAFWLGPSQVRVARQIAGLSDVWWTNTEQHAQWLRSKVVPTQPCNVWPVFSNIGEPQSSPTSDARPPTMLLFGSEATRRRAVMSLRQHPQLLRALQVTRRVEVGEGAPCLTSLAGIECCFEGYLQGQALTQALHDAKFGLIDYAARALAKSSVFAAYAAHGCLTVNTHHDAQPADGLLAGQHYLSAQGLTGAKLEPHAMQRQADLARAWYAAHGQLVQATALLCLVAGQRLRETSTFHYLDISTSHDTPTVPSSGGPTKESS